MGAQMMGCSGASYNYGGQRKGGAQTQAMPGQGATWSKGKGVHSPMKSRAELEAALVQIADALHAGALDLNVDVNMLDSKYQQLKSTRAQVLASYGVSVPEQAAPGNPDMSMKGAGAYRQQKGGKPRQSIMPAKSNSMVPTISTDEQGNIVWRNALFQACTKRSKAAPQKGDFIYETIQDPNGGGYMSTISSVSGQMQSSYSSPAPCPSKKSAEDEAAKIAFECEFPDMFHMVLAQQGGIATKVSQNQSGKKRKADQISSRESNARSELHESIHLLCGRAPIQGDMVFETVDCPGGGYTSLIRLPNYDLEQSWTCPHGETKKLAEEGACAAVLAELSHILEPLKASHAEKKARLLQEKKAAQMARRQLGQSEAAPSF